MKNLKKKLLSSKKQFARVFFITSAAFWMQLVSVFSYAELEDKVKADVFIGPYQLTASSPTKSGKFSNFGSYSLVFRKQILLSSIELGGGYSIFSSNLIGGDMGFGPDFLMYYYPYSYTGPFVEKSKLVTIKIDEVYRPFIGLGFHQRSFQSLSSSYAGFGVFAGSDFQYSSSFAFRCMTRYINMTGPEKASATYFDLLIGFTFSL